MGKLNVQKKYMIEILKLIEDKTREVAEFSVIFPNNTAIINFGVYFYIRDGEVKGDVYFEKIGQLNG
jgi:hypothetical protein